MNIKELKINSRNDLIDAINEYGFMPYFKNSVEGFSIEEHIAPKYWFADESGAWEWKGPVIRETGCAYGKFFEHKAVYISKEWFPDFANYRRDGYDFDALYDDGLAKYGDKVLYDLVDKNAPVISKELKKLGDYRKGGVKGFDSAMNRLQAECYVIISDFVYLKNKNGEQYGWGVAEYSTPEKVMGDSFSDNVYRREPQESYRRVFEHLKKILPDADDKQIEMLLK